MAAGSLIHRFVTAHPDLDLIEVGVRSSGAWLPNVLVARFASGRWTVYRPTKDGWEAIASHPSSEFVALDEAKRFLIEELRRETERRFRRR